MVLMKEAWCQRVEQGVNGRNRASRVYVEAGFPGFPGLPGWKCPGVEAPGLGMSTIIQVLR